MNQFSESLLTIPYSHFGCWSWHDIPDGIFFSNISQFSPTDVNTDEEWAEQKATFLCFIIAMSDEDLHECFGIPLPASHKKA